MKNFFFVERRVAAGSPPRPLGLARRRALSRLSAWRARTIT